MFDPSKLNLDLDENEKVSEQKTPEEIKSELEKVEKDFDNNEFLKKEENLKKQEIIKEEKDILGNIEKKFIDKDLERNKNKKYDQKLKEKNEIKEKKKVVGDISSNIDINKELNKKKKEDILSKDLIDINIVSLEDILNIMNKNGADIFIFEPRDTDIKIIFKDGKLEKDTKYIKFPIYNQILLKAKAISKMKVEEVKIGQDGKGEIQIKDSKYEINSKTIPSAFGEKLFLKIKKLEKKIIPKSKQKTSIGTLIGFLATISVLALIIGGAFIGFIVVSAQNISDVNFFLSMGINVNEINSFIESTVRVIFLILLFIETVFLSIFGFKAILTKKIYKKKKISYIIFSIILLLFTLSTASAFLYINKKISELPNWQLLTKGNVQIFDNSKLLSGNFNENETIIEDTSNLIGPITLKFDLSGWAYQKKQKGFNIKKFIWSFNGKKEESKTVPIFIKTFDEKGNYDILVDIIGENTKGKEEKITINNIDSIGISNVVNIEEKVDKLGLKTVNFDASDLKSLGEIEWYYITEGKEKNTNTVGYRFFTGKIVEKTMIGILIKREGKISTKLDKIFIIKKEEESKIQGKIIFKQDLIDDLKYSFYVENPDTAFGNGIVETFEWKIENDTIKKEAGIEDVEGSSKIEHKFKKYGKQEVEVELKDSSGKIKILKIEVNVPKRLKLKSKNILKIYNDGELLTDEIRYESKNNEYFIDELNIPTILKFDARLVRTNDIFYKLNSVSWDLDDDGKNDKTGKVLDLNIDNEGNRTIIANYKFIHRKNKEDIVTIRERIYIESIKKDAILKLKIIPKNKYVPTFVKFDASLTKIKGKNIEKFIYDYGDGTGLDERDAINQAHKYNVAGEYNIKLTVVTTDGSKYNISKKLILKPKPQKANITSSIKTTETYQEIDFSSEGSEGQITGYFWDFGDGEVSTEANPSHSFEEPGNYNVKLKLTFQNNNILENEIEIKIKEY